MHYTRQRRTGSPDETRRPGPAPSQYRQMTRKTFSEWSDRTFARYWAAVRLLAALDRETGNELQQAAVSAAVRANGSLNVSKLERIAEIELMRSVMRSQ